MVSVKIFSDQHPFIGPLMWFLSVQYFITQIIVAMPYKGVYSLRVNTISDLGNSVCGYYSHRYVCSPLHNVMNISFTLLGITMIAGSILIYQASRKGTALLIGFSFMALAGIGSILVGFFPENTISFLHVIGAGLPFVFGNTALVIFGLYLNIPKVLRLYTILSGVLALIASVLFVTQNYIGLGVGGVERLVAYPQTLWLIVFGLYKILIKYHRRTNFR